MAVSDDPISTGEGVMTPAVAAPALQFLIRASNELGEARVKHAEAFLLAKLSNRKPTDRQAEASADVETGAKLTAAETQLYIAKVQYAAALGVGEV